LNLISRKFEIQYEERKLKCHLLIVQHTICNDIVQILDIDMSNPKFME